MRDQSGKHPVKSDGLAANVHDATGHPQEHADHRDNANEAKLLADHSQQKVGMGFGQPIEFLNTATQTHTKNLATPDGNQRVGELITFAQGVLFGPRIEVGKNAFASPLTESDHQTKGHHQDSRDQKKHAGIHAPQKQNAHRDHGNHHEGAHVRLGQQQQAHHGNRSCHWRDGAKEVFLDLHFANHVVGRIQEHRKFGQFGRLKIHDAQGNPAPGTIDALADMGNQHSDQQNQRRDKQPGRHLLPGSDRNLKSHQRAHESDDQGDRMTEQKMSVRVVRKLGVIRHGDGSRINHDQPPHQQDH